MSRQISKSIVGGVFVGFAERWIVEDLLDEFVNGQPIVQHHHSDMNELGGVFADDAHAEQLAVRSRCLHRARALPRSRSLFPCRILPFRRPPKSPEWCKSPWAASRRRAACI